MLVDFLKEINEGRSEKGQGSKEGREKFTSKKGTGGRTVKARKSRVKVYDTIDAALKSGATYGTIFSTKAADRLYVISKPTWGEKSRAGGNTRIAKGFTPGAATPSASWPSIKAHAVRTGLKHGKSKSKRLTKVYGSGKPKAEEKRYKGKTTSSKDGESIKEIISPYLKLTPSQEKEKKEKRRATISNPSDDAKITKIVKTALKRKKRGLKIRDLSGRNRSRLSQIAASTKLVGPLVSEELDSFFQKVREFKLIKKELTSKEIADKNEIAFARLVAAQKVKQEKEKRGKQVKHKDKN